MPLDLVINPGSTSTKIGLFENGALVRAKTIAHPAEDLASFDSIAAQKGYRAAAVTKLLEEEGCRPEDIGGVIAIGGLLYPCDSGVYLVDEAMCADLECGRYNEHASNLGALLAWDFAQKTGLPAYIADPVTTDEMGEVARLSGMPELQRSGRCHALNQKRMARRAACELGLEYERARLVVAHLGGGISVTAHCDGRMTDTSNPRGEGPFCIDRTGGLNSYQLVQLCYSGKYDKRQMLKKISGEGGVVAYLGTRDFREVERRADAGDAQAKAVFDALAYQVAKEIAAMCVPLGGRPEAIVLTGGMAHSEALVKSISTQAGWLGRIVVYPGEEELEALAEYLREVRAGTCAPKRYCPKGENDDV